VERYLREPLAPEQTLILDYWKQNRQHYPIISKIARHFLAVQASSVESEREFSITEDVISKTRNRLSVSERNRLELKRPCI
jgi:hAT family C-terminal dimerisation region